MWHFCTLVLWKIYGTFILLLFIIELFNELLQKCSYNLVAWLRILVDFEKYVCGRLVLHLRNFNLPRFANHLDVTTKGWRYVALQMIRGCLKCNIQFVPIGFAEREELSISMSIFQEKEVVTRTTASRSSDTERWQAREGVDQRTREWREVRAYPRRARVARRNTVATEPPSRPTSCTSWKGRSRKAIIRTCTAGRNWRWRLISQKWGCRWVIFDAPVIAKIDLFIYHEKITSI